MNMNLRDHFQKAFGFAVDDAALHMRDLPNVSTQKTHAAPPRLVTGRGYVYAHSGRGISAKDADDMNRAILSRW